MCKMQQIFYETHSEETFYPFFTLGNQNTYENGNSFHSFSRPPSLYAAVFTPKVLVVKYIFLVHGKRLDGLPLV